MNVVHQLHGMVRMRVWNLA